MITLLFLILALLCFIAAAANASWPPINFVGLGLAFVVLSWLLRGVAA